MLEEVKMDALVDVVGRDGHVPAALAQFQVRRAGQREVEAEVDHRAAVHRHRLPKKMEQQK